MNDLVMRLRLFADCAMDDLSIGDEAADEIERLRELLTLAGMYVNPYIDKHADAMELWKRIDEALR